MVGHYICASMLARIFFTRLYISLASVVILGQHDFVDLKLA
jgi:hypothetical protein